MLRGEGVRDEKDADMPSVCSTDDLPSPEDLEEFKAWRDDCVKVANCCCVLLSSISG